MDVCYYCDKPVIRKSEKDHFPVPNELGGKDTVTSCLSCHDLKDRSSLDDITVAVAFMGGLHADWPNLSPITRIYLARIFQTFLRSRDKSSVAEIVKACGEESRRARALREAA
jgi:hypothetical protein